MALILDYRNTRAHFLAHSELVWGDHYRSCRSSYHLISTLSAGILLWGAYLCFQANQVFLACFLAALGGWIVVRAFRYSGEYWSAVQQEVSKRAETQIRLEVAEDGLHEIVEGIQSFAPWAAVKSFTEYRNTLFIQLAAGLWAIIPRDAVSPSPSAVDEFIRILRQKGIKESSSQHQRPMSGKKALMAAWVARKTRNR